MANDGRWKFQSIVIVLSTLNIINVEAEVNDRNSGTFPPSTLASVPTDPLNTLQTDFRS